MAGGIQRPKIDMHAHVWRMPDWETSADHLVNCAHMLGITEVWTSSVIHTGIIAPPDEVRKHNDTTLAAMGRHPDCLRGWCFIIPGHGSASIEEAERCLEAGMIGIKLYNQYRLNDAAVRPIIELSVERRVPVLGHAGYLVGEHMRTQPLISYGEHFTDTSLCYPDAILIHAHIGGGGDWEYTVRQMRDASPNVYIDVSGSNLDDGQVEFAVTELGVERVLFGTDGTMAGSVGKVLEADLTEDERELIFWGNAERILAAQGASPLHPRDTAGQVVAGATAAPSQSTANGIGPLFDVNAWLGAYPFRSLRDGDVEGLLCRMDRAGITAAAVSWIDAAFHRCPQPGNELLAEAISGHRDRLVPMATINPDYPAWEDDLEDCDSRLGMKGVRIFPHYAGYSVNGSATRAIASACAERGLPLFIPHRLEDQRQHHRIDPGRVVDLSEIADLVAHVPEATIVVPNARGVHRSALWQREELRDQRWFVDLSLTEIFYVLHSASIDDSRELVDLLDEGGASHLLFGTHLPYSYGGPALVKRAILPVDDDALRDISYRTAERLLGIELTKEGLIAAR